MDNYLPFDCLLLFLRGISRKSKFLSFLTVPVSHGSSVLTAQQDKFSHSVMSHSVQAPAQMTELLSLGTATSTGEHLHVSQPVCFLLGLNLSSFRCLLSLFSCSLFYSSQHSLSVTHCPVENKGTVAGDKCLGHFGIQTKVIKGKQIDLICLNANVPSQYFLQCLFLLL